MMNNIDPNVIIICVTALLAVAGIVAAVCGIALVSVWYLSKHKATGNTTESYNSGISGISGPNNQNSTNGDCKRPKVDYEDLSNLTDDELLNEFNNFETRGKLPHSMGLVERKQALALEMHTRNKAAEKRQTKEDKS